jgi:glucose/mannose-6-phosphate isomerase
MSLLDDREKLREGDPSGMAGHIEGLPQQLEQGLAIGRDAELGLKGEGLSSIALFGMGGSAIGGAILKGYLQDRLGLPFEVVRSYSVPAYVGPRTLVVISSYSGDTEEVLSAHDEAAARGAGIVCLTTGGELLDRARASGHGFIRIPGGLPPRAALGFSFAPLLVVLSRLGMIDDPSEEVAAAIATAREAVERLGLKSPSESNAAKELAEWLDGGVPVIYGTEPRTAPVATRWRTQFAENAKVWAHSAALPEMNHNEVVPLRSSRAAGREKRFVFLRDAEDHPRVALRVEITSRMLDEAGAGVRAVVSFGRSRLARLFSLVILGDFTSFYLAALTGVDPTPIAPIDELKEALNGFPDA